MDWFVFGLACLVVLIPVLFIMLAIIKIMTGE